MIKYSQENTASRTSVLYDTFLSVDFSKASANLAPQYSPNSLNMIRDEYGKIRRRMGYYEILDLREDTAEPSVSSPEQNYTVWGLTRYRSEMIVHCGTGLYRVTESDGETQTELIYSGLAAGHSWFYQAGESLYILDGADFFIYDGETAKRVEGRTPILGLGGTPAGSATLYEQINFLTNKWEQHFTGDGSSREYQLLLGDLDETPVKAVVEKLQDGELIEQELVENTDFTVDRVAGVVTFNTAPPSPPVANEDNVFITASKDRSEKRALVLGCRAMKPFGINGSENQIFLGGNPQAPNLIFWSDIADPTFWGEYQYAELGQDNSAVMSFSTLNTQLIAHKDPASGQNYLCSVYAEDHNGALIPQVRIDKVVGGSGCVCRYGSAQFGEPLFVTQLGVQAITTRDIAGYEIETLRGDRINRQLIAEPRLSEAVGCVYKYFYLLAVPGESGSVYVLDRLNPTGEGNVLGNAYQYNAFYWDHVPARCWMVDAGELYFGTEDGRVMKFYTDEAASASYNDNGEAYEWLWELPEYVGNRFYNNKAIKYLALRAKAYLRAYVVIDVQVDGLWYEVLRDNVSFGFLDLNDLDLNNLNLSTDRTPKKTTQKYSRRRLDKFAFRIRGDTVARNAVGEPFGLYSFAFEVKERGKHKG
ncbi:DUF2460 domain-containing protein [Feifania hominis]|uniref:Uncharacterized protein n=1 Tax=Feifania hominis TaxID=2763660 RepID=A0A926HUS8_9FIRM|nr:DUF2460 domain-containing protein [Feifania hominis]MBC8537229.1 hypothetical protein [Feifania hominis]